MDSRDGHRYGRRVRQFYPALLVAALDGITGNLCRLGQSKARTATRWSVGCVPEERLLLERYYFDPPVSPHLAAREAGVRIALDSFELPAPVANHPYILEGAGGGCAAQRAGFDADLMRRLGLPIRRRGAQSLGTINHTLLTTCRAAWRAIGASRCRLIGTKKH